MSQQIARPPIPHLPSSDGRPAALFFGGLLSALLFAVLFPWFPGGQILDVGAEGLDVYNSMLTTMGCTERLGPQDREVHPVDAIRA